VEEVEEASPFRFDNCRGTLSWDEGGQPQGLPMSFAIAVDNCGNVRITFDPEPLTANAFRLKAASLSKSPLAPRFSLSGTTADGHEVRSDAIWIKRVHAGGDPKAPTLDLEATASRLDVVMAGASHLPGAEWHVEHWIPGLQCLGTIDVETASGHVLIRGSTKINDWNQISGLVAIRKALPTDEDPGDWIDTADVTARRVLDALSFADGHFLRTSVKRICREDTLTRIEFYGAQRTSSPYKPPLYFLDYNRSIPQLLQSYTPSLIERTGLDVALEWHLMPHTYNEQRYLAQMTAIEHLVHVYSDHTPASTYLPKAVFKKQVRPALKTTLEEQLKSLTLPSEVLQVAHEGISQGLGNANRRSLQSNLLRMLADYRVPPTDLVDLVPKLIEVRNEIVHQGLHPGPKESDSLLHYLAAAEELLTRVALSLLGYVGPYRTWFRRIEDCEWPPVVVSP